MLINSLKNEIAKIIIGHEEVIDLVLVGFFSKGHILLESVPGLAKTTMIKTLAKAMDLEFKRVQFTPDLLPSDIVGVEIYNQKSNEFSIKKGPIFTNLLLADEINRAPAKVQSALLEVMQEKQVTIGDETYKLTPPFMVLATQNPIEQFGAYALPEAQLDRFMMKILVDYNNKEEELQIAKKAKMIEFESIRTVIGASDFEAIVEEIDTVHMDEELETYLIDFIFASRYPKEYGLDELSKFISFGASPRSSIDLFKGVRAMAYIMGQDYVDPKVIAKVLKPILRHRIHLSYEAQAQNITTDWILDEIAKKVVIP